MSKTLCCKGALLLLSCAPLKAQENVNELADKLPSIAFLEYLAEMEEVDDKLLGPQDMYVEPCQDSTAAQEKQNNETRNEINGVQNDKPPKNEDPAIKHECKYHD